MCEGTESIRMEYILTHNLVHVDQAIVLHNSEKWKRKWPCEHKTNSHKNRVYTYASLSACWSGHSPSQFWKMDKEVTMWTQNKKPLKMQQSQTTSQTSKQKLHHHFHTRECCPVNPANLNVNTARWKFLRARILKECLTILSPLAFFCVFFLKWTLGHTH